MKTMQSLCLALIVAVSGCGGSEGNVRPPPVNVRWFHAAPSFETLAFLREEVVEAQTVFTAGGASRFDSGQYDFHLEYAPAGASSSIRVPSFSATLSPNLDYTFVAVAPGGQLDTIVVGVDKIPISASDSRFTVIHANPDLAAVDVYFELPGTLLSGAQERGTVSFGPNATTFLVTPQTVRLYLTPQGAPNTILFESTDLPIGAGGDNTIVIAGTGGQGPRDIVVVDVKDSATRIREAGLSSEIRVVHGVDDRMDRDIMLDGESMPPLFPIQPFGQFSDYAPLTAEVHELALTPVATPGTVEDLLTFSYLSGFNYTAVYVAGSSLPIRGGVFREDLRRIPGQATVRVLNAAGMFGILNVYILAPGTAIDTVFPQASLSTPDLSERLPTVPGDYEITIQNQATATIVAGPEPITIEANGLYGVLLLNALGGSTVDIEYFYDFAP